MEGLYMERHILVVFPHPDDEAFGAAGTIVLDTKKGVPVTYACLTLGEMGRNMGNPIFANRETLPQLRKKELIEACKVMGIQDLRMLGFRDKTLEFEEESILISKIKEIIDEIKPSLVITHYPNHGVHPDHDACGWATVKAVSLLKAGERPEVHCIALTKNRIEALGEPNISVDISSVSNVKLDTIKAHRSQTEGMIGEIEKQLDEQNPQIQNWLKTESFWTYPFEK